jgi:predicted dehydrogenase
MSIKPVKVGIIGCGSISGAYLSTLPKFAITESTAVADLIPERAQAKAAKHNIPRACTVEELLADPSIEIVLNLTIPNAHYSVALAAVKAGKSVYNEKPLCITRAQGRELLDTAKAQGVLVGCAPDTVLGGGHQTCRKLVQDGVIGEPIAATAFMMCHGHEGWHPDPEFYYKAGGGPMFDMGPYYLTALITMMGPVRRVTGSARATFPERLITSQPKNGTKITVDVPTHIAGVMDFANGAIGTIITSFDVWGANLPCIEVHGSEGSLSVPDPNGFGGQPRVKLSGKDWEDVPLSHIYTDNCRGIGVADMAYALRFGRPHRANGDVAYHVLDLMHAFHDASREGKHIIMESTMEKPAIFPVGLEEGKLDEKIAVTA